MSTTCSTKPSKKGITLCASCDRCRARKTKCDGKRPCGNCAARYMKKHRLTSIDGVDVSLFDCIYSPAKRRGPVPGKAGQTRKAEEMKSNYAGSAKGNSNLMRMDMGIQNGYGNFANVNVSNGNMLMNQQAQLAAMGMAQAGGGAVDVNNNGIQGQDALTLQNNLLMQQQMAAMQGMGLNNQAGVMPDFSSTSSSFGNFNQQGLNGSFNQNTMNQQQQQQLNLLALQQSQQLQQKDAFDMMQQQMQPNNGTASSSSNSTHQDGNAMPPLSQRARTEGTSENGAKTNKNISKHLDLLLKSSNEGNRLRSHFTLSIGGLFQLPPIPSDEEYCAKLNPAMSPSMLPQFDLAALRAARFAEIALGALVCNQVPLALELSNATVLCLKECAEEHIHPGCMYDVARAYFLHATFRSYRGDMERYFNYRSVCLTKLTQLRSEIGNEALLAAIAFQDAWAYILYNGDENATPVNDSFSGAVLDSTSPVFNSPAEQKYQTNCSLAVVAAGRDNQKWIQGAPPVFINNEAPPLCRALDALACAMRSCCDQANSRFEDMAAQISGGDTCSPKTTSLTSAAIMANKDELCPRNMVLSAFTLLQQHESCIKVGERNQGYHLLISGMDAFLENGDEDEGGFTDAQVQSLLSVCNLVIEHPAFLFQGGLSYHMVSNAAILLSHLLNGLYSKREEFPDHPRDMEEALFDEVLDTYISVRKILSSHRRKLSPILRCHGLPRPKILCYSKKPETSTDQELVIDLSETLMCASRACQGFVLIGCSPCVAAERARNAKMNADKMVALEEETLDNYDTGSNERFQSLRSEFDMDDDALLSVLSRIIAS